MSFFTTTEWTKYLNIVKNIKNITIDNKNFPKNGNEIGKLFSNFLEFENNFKISNHFLTSIDHFCQNNNIDSIHFRFHPSLHPHQIPLKILLNNNWTISNGVTLLIDLKQSQQELWKKLRKRYKSTINKQNKLYHYKILDYSNNSSKYFNDWVELYANNLKGIDKNKYPTMFNFHHQLIEKNKAILVLGYDTEQAIGGMFFTFDKSHANYSFGANNPSAHNIGHSIMWHAIEELKERGLKSLELGGLSYKNQISTAFNLKNSNITHFKEGFPADLCPVYFFSKLYTDSAKQNYIKTLKENLDSNKANYEL